MATKIDRRLDLKWMFVFTGLVAASLSLIVMDSGASEAVGVTWLISLGGGAIGFMVRGKRGYVYGAICTPFLVLLVLIILSSPRVR